MRNPTHMAPMAESPKSLLVGLGVARIQRLWCAGSRRGDLRSEAIHMAGWCAMADGSCHSLPSWGGWLLTQPPGLASRGGSGGRERVRVGRTWFWGASVPSERGTDRLNLCDHAVLGHLAVHFDRSLEGLLRLPRQASRRMLVRWKCRAGQR